MNITQSQRTYKFTITNISDSEMMDLWYACWQTHQDKLADNIIIAIKKSLDVDDILSNHGYTVDEYLYYAKANYHTFKVKYPYWLVWKCWDLRYDRLNDDVLSSVKHDINHQINNELLGQRLSILDEFSEYSVEDLQQLADYVIKEYY